MTDPVSASRVRLFVAIDIGESIRSALAALQEQLRLAQADIRWVRVEGMHLTLEFLGEAASDRLPAIRQAMELALGKQGARTLELAGLGVFPNARQPRVLWCGVEGGELEVLKQRLATALRPLGFGSEDRSFQPHVTLGRIRSRSGWNDLWTLFEAHRKDHFGSIEVHHVGLYQSELRSGGSVYTLLNTTSL